MAIHELYHLPAFQLEINFCGDETACAELQDFRPVLKDKLIKHLIKEGVVFEEPGNAEYRNPTGGAFTPTEAAIDTWVRANDFEWKKAADRNSKKVRWVLDAAEEVTILLSPQEQLGEHR